MQYQSDYVLRLIEQMGDLIRRAGEQMRAGGTDNPYLLADQAISLALDLKPELTAHLAPHSLVSLLEMASLDERVISLVAQALELEAELLEGQAELIAGAARRNQAQAVRSLLGPTHAN